jgi:hypothetical protein
MVYHTPRCKKKISSMTFCQDVPNKQFFQADMLVIQRTGVLSGDCRLDQRLIPSNNPQQEVCFCTDHSKSATATFLNSICSSIRMHGTNFKHTQAPSTDFLLECSDLLYKRCQLHSYLLNRHTPIRRHKCATFGHTSIIL